MKLILGHIYYVEDPRIMPGRQHWFVGIFRGEDRYKIRISWEPERNIIHSTYVFDLLASPEWGASAVSISKSGGKDAREIFREDLPLYLHADVIHPLFDKVLKTGKTKRIGRKRRVINVVGVRDESMISRLVRKVSQKIAFNSMYIILNVGEGKVKLEPYQQHLDREKNPTMGNLYTFLIPQERVGGFGVGDIVKEENGTYKAVSWIKQKIFELF